MSETDQVVQYRLSNGFCPHCSVPVKIIQDEASIPYCPRCHTLFVEQSELEYHLNKVKQ